MASFGVLERRAPYRHVRRFWGGGAGLGLSAWGSVLAGGFFGLSLSLCSWLCACLGFACFWRPGFCCGSLAVQVLLPALMFSAAGAGLGLLAGVLGRDVAFRPCKSGFGDFLEK